jgi:hypothetical protein
VASLGLVPEIRPEVFDSLKTIAVAIDAARNDRCNITQELLRKFELSLSSYNPFDTPSLVSTVEKMILSALYCGQIMERNDVKALMVDSAANARRHREVVSQQINEIIISAIFKKWPNLISGGNIRKLPRPHTAHGISAQIKQNVSRMFKEKNIRSGTLSVSAITKRVEKLIKLSRTAE